MIEWRRRGKEWEAFGNNLAYLITSATAGWVCSLEIMSGDQTGSAEQSDDTCRTTDGRCNRRSLPTTKRETTTFAALVDCAGDQAGTVFWEELVLMRADGAER